MDPYAIALQCPHCGETATLSLDPFRADADLSQLALLEAALLVGHRHQPRPRPDDERARAGVPAARRSRHSPRLRRFRPGGPLGSGDGT